MQWIVKDEAQSMKETLLENKFNIEGVPNEIIEVLGWRIGKHLFLLFLAEDKHGRYKAEIKEIILCKHLMVSKEFNGKIYMWCQNCGRWSLSHHTGTHRDKKTTKLDTRFDEIIIDNNDSEITGITDLMSDSSLLETPRSNGSKMRGFNIDKILEEWTPEKKRDNRSLVKNISKIESFGEEAMVGGDWIVGELRQPMTLAFAFEGPQGTKYAGKILGVTCMHITLKAYIGAPIYKLTSSRRNHGPTKLIGKIVHACSRTDSLIFEFNSDIKVDVNKVRISNQTIHEFDFFNFRKIQESMSNAVVGTSLYGFGAQRRGTTGKVCCTIQPGQWPEGPMKVGDVGIDSYDPLEEEIQGSKMITHDGDCGMLYFNDDGVPLIMHQLLTSSKNTPICHTSWGVQLQNVITAHAEYFGIYDSSKEIKIVHQLQAASPDRYNGVSIPPQQFKLSFLPGEEPRYNFDEFIVHPRGAVHLKVQLPHEEKIIKR